MASCVRSQFTRSRHNRRADQRLIRGNFGLGGYARGVSQLLDHAPWSVSGLLRSRDSGGPCRAVVGSDVGKLGAEETRAAEVCAAGIGACEIGVPKIGTAGVSPQGRVRQVGLSQRGAWGVGP